MIWESEVHLYFLIGATISLNLYTHNEINKDGAYFLDEEKPKYISLVWLVPIIGAVIAQYRLNADKTFYMTVMGIFSFYGMEFIIFYMFGCRVRLPSHQFTR